MARRTVMLIGAAGGTVGYIGYSFITDLVALYFIGAFAVGVSMVNVSQLFAYVSEVVALRA